MDATHPLTVVSATTIKLHSQFANRIHHVINAEVFQIILSVNILPKTARELSDAHK